jgi:hypothetical protein
VGVAAWASFTVSILSGVMMVQHFSIPMPLTGNKVKDAKILGLHSILQIFFG